MKQNRHKFNAITTVLLLAVLLWIILSKPQLSNEPDAHILKARSSVVPGISEVSLALTNKEYSTPSQHDQLVITAALEGTDIDGRLRADANGYLILEQDVRDFFDYFLSAADELGPQLVISEMQRYINQYLPDSAKAEALDLLANYLRFKRAEFTVQQTPLSQDLLSDASALALLRASFQELKNERRALFTSEQEFALFGLEDAYAEHTLASLELMADPNSSDQGKAAKLQDLEAALPEAISDNLQTSRVQRQRQEKIETLVNSTHDDAQIYDALIDIGYSQSKTEEIISHRQQQQLFNSQYKNYQHAKAVLNTELPGYQQSLNRLQAQFFTSPEALTQAKLRDLNQD